MAALVAYAPSRMNWPRVGAWSGTMALHAGLLMLLLTPPVAMQAIKHLQENPITVTVITPEEPKEIKIPDPPVPKHKEAPPPPRRIERVVTQAPPADVPDNTMGIPTQDPGPPASNTDSIAPAKDTAPTALAYNFRTKVSYPLAALRRGDHGTVILRVLVGADGLPQTIEIEKSSGSRDLDNAARDAVKRWTFSPGTHNGVAQAGWARVPIAFDLQQY